MIPLPKDPTDTEALADWCELHALALRDGNISRADVESALSLSSVFESAADPTRRLEEQVADVLAAIDRRAAYARDGYPFSLDGQVVQRRDVRLLGSSYVFCLLVSNLALVPSVDLAFPRRYFEALSRDVAATFLGGHAVRFGSPRVPAEIPKSFKHAVDALCIRLREGGHFSGQPTHWDKDWGLDVVGWRDHADALSGKLLMFGACATGEDWPQKVNQLQPTNFCNEWMARQPCSTPLKSFFLPYTVPSARWESVSRSAGMVFDRCRIAATLPAMSFSLEHGRVRAWLALAIRELRRRCRT